LFCTDKNYHFEFNQQPTLVFPQKKAQFEINFYNNIVSSVLNYKVMLSHAGNSSISTQVNKVVLA